MIQQTTPAADLNWRRELLFACMAAMEVSWLAGWVLILLGADRTAGLTTAWLATFALYIIATTAARILSGRRSPRVDWIIGSLALGSTLLFVKLNMYPGVSVLNPRWLAILVGNITSGLQTWPRELTALFIGFFVWFRGLRLPGRRTVSIRATWRQVQFGLVIMVALAIATLQFPINIAGLVVVYFVSSLLSLALTRIEETTRSAQSASSPFGRNWLVTLAIALLIVGMIALLGRTVLTVTILRALLRPFAIAVEVVLSAFALVLGLFAQYVLLPLFAALVNRFLPEGLRIELPDRVQQEGGLPLEEGEPVQPLLASPDFLNAVRVVGLALIALIVLWLVVRSFRRWRVIYHASGGVHEPARPASSLSGEVMAYLQDQWERLRGLADIRRLLELRGTGTVRAIYADMLTLMAAAGRPRPAGKTPFEYEPTIQGALPEHGPEISAITEAYVKVRYGGIEVRGEEMQRLRTAWGHVRTAGEELVRTRSTET